LVWYIFVSLQYQILTNLIMRTIDKIITKVDTSRGAPMGRTNVGTKHNTIMKTVFDCRVPLTSDGAYDKGGAYWGCGAELRVSYTKDLSFIRFYRVGCVN
jgi:hypothetical protein